MRGLFCTAVLVVAAVIAAPAGAGTVTAGGFPMAVTYTAGAGETNNVVIQQASSPTHVMSISDTAGVTAGGGCTQIDATHANCGSLNAGPLTANLGDQNDSLTYGETGISFTITANGGTGNDTISTNGIGMFGPAGRSATLNGEDGDDTLTGGSNNDTIDGGAGADTLSGAGNNDTVNGGFDGDIVNGGDGNDTLNGGYGADTLQGTIGHDTLEGGPGPDAYFGGDGDDLLKNSYDNDDLNGNAGTDTVDYSTIGESIDTSCFPTPCPIGVEVTFDNVANDGSWDLDQTGNFVASDNVHSDVEAVIGTPQADTLNGTASTLDQRFTGGRGNDTITGGAGTDLLLESAAAESAGLTMTLGTSTLTGFLGSDTFTGIENFDLSGGAGTDTLNASAATVGVTLRGNANDTVIGGSGNDTLIDGALLTGGPGDDSINGGGGTNTLVETVDANLTLTNTALTGGLGTDTLANISRATLTGGAGNNTLNASAFTNGPVTLDGGAGIDLLQGGSGADTLTGGLGNDTLDGGASNADTLVESANANMTLASSSMTGVGSDSLANIELATLNGGDSANVLNAAAFGRPVTVNGGGGADTITGGPLADTLNGGDDNDTIVGGDAMDILNGDGGADTLNGGLSLDVLHGGDGDDSLDGGADAVNDILDGDAGENRVVASGDTNFTLTDTNLVGLGNDTLTEITRATLTGGAGDNALNASAFTLGPVILSGGAGADTLLGGSGGDTLTGGPGLDAFDAGAGADTVQARDGVNESSIVCGTETDTAVVDVGDTPNTDCDIEQLPDTKAPNTKLTKAPKAKTKSRTATFRFASTEAGSKFQCKLDKKAWASCKAPRTYKRLKKGKHTFQVRAKDVAGNLDKTPAKKTWRIT